MIDDISYASTHVLVPNPLRKQIQEAAKSIPDDALADPGRELDSHVTLLYGLTEDDPEPVSNLLSGIYSFSLMTNGISVFERPEYDVLKINIISPGAELIHSLLKSRLSNKWEWPSYEAHCTVGYVHKGLGRIYCAPGVLPKFVGDLFHVSEVVFSDSKEKKTIIPLKKGAVS